MTSQFLQQANALKETIIGWKRHLHQHPELGMKEFETTAFVRRELEKMGIEIKPLNGAVGVLGIIRGDKDNGPVIGLRADLDAMPIQEETDLPDKSLVPGVMHACGHDCHTAMLLGAAKILTSFKDQFHLVKLLFQPAEETLQGARYMINNGCLKDPDVDVLLGLHGIGHETGTLNFLPGSAMASSDSFSVTVNGIAGHGAYPHRSGADPVLAAAHCIVALQGMVTRQLDAISPTVLSVCTVHGGTAKNAVPDHVEFGGTVRCQSSAVRQSMEGKIKKTVEGIASSCNCTCSLEYHYGCPNLVNDPDVTAVCRKAAEELIGAEHVKTIPFPAMGSEDFAFYTEVIKRCSFARLGIAQQGRPVLFHNGHFVFDENALPVGTGYFVQSVLEFNRQ